MRGSVKIEIEGVSTLRHAFDEVRRVEVATAWTCPATDAMDATSAALTAVGISMTVVITDVVGIPLELIEVAGILATEFLETGVTTLEDVETELKVSAAELEVVARLDDETGVVLADAGLNGQESSRSINDLRARVPVVQLRSNSRVNCSSPHNGLFSIHESCLCWEAFWSLLKVASLFVSSCNCDNNASAYDYVSLLMLSR